jgi:hypothetical protein
VHINLQNNIGAKKMNSEQLIEGIREHAKKYASEKATKEHLEEYKKSKLAILMKKYETHYDAANAQEREARKDPEYLELLEGLKVATENAEMARWELKMMEMRFEIWRTKHADRRAERSRYGA